MRSIFKNLLLRSQAFLEKDAKRQQALLNEATQLQDGSPRFASGSRGPRPPRRKREKRNSAHNDRASRLY